jgi:integrase
MPKKRRRYGTGSLFLNGRTWWLRYYSNGQRETENSQLEDRSAAEDLLKQRVAEAAAGQIEVSAGRATIADLCELVLADHRLRKLRDAKTVEWRYLAHVKSAFGKIQASRATARHIGSYIEDRRSAGASDSTINRELSIVRRAYTLGMREDPPIVRKAPYIPKLEEDNVRQGFLEPEQYEQLLAELPANLKALFVCAYHTGARKNELRRALWDQVDFESGMIRLTVGQTKSKKARTLPIYGDMERWLRIQQESAKGSAWVFRRPEETGLLEALRVDGSVRARRLARIEVPRFAPLCGPQYEAGRRSRQSCDGDQRTPDALHLRSLQHRGRRRPGKRGAKTGAIFQATQSGTGSQVEARQIAIDCRRFPPISARFGTQIAIKLVIMLCLKCP